MERRFPGISGKRKTWRGVFKFSEISYQRFSVPFDFPPEFPDFSVDWFTFGKFNNFWSFCNHFQEISAPSLLYHIFKILVQWKAPHSLKLRETFPFFTGNFGNSKLQTESGQQLNWNDTLPTKQIIKDLQQVVGKVDNAIQRIAWFV